MVRVTESIVRAQREFFEKGVSALRPLTLQQIADDVGISPERVKRAARKLDVREPIAPPVESGPGAFWLGSPTVIVWERVVNGEVGKAVYDEIIDEVQATLSTEGKVDTLGKSLTWRTEKPVLGKRRAIQVRVTSRSGKTRINVQERLGELAWTTFPTTWGIGAGGIAILLSLGGPEFGWAAAGLLSAGWTGGMYVLSRKIFRYISRKKRTDLQQLSDRIAEIAAESAQDRLDSSQTTRALPG